MARELADLVCIDAQHDFCDKTGTLMVPGAWEAMERGARLVSSPFGRTLNDLHFTLDLHPHMHIAHNVFWQDSLGAHPAPFTEITVDDVESKRWQPVIPALYGWCLQYVRSLKQSARYVLRVWPPHCKIGFPGSAIVAPMGKALDGWCESQQATVDFVSKGSNWKTEHYSAMRAEVIDPADPTTQLNKRLIETLEKCDKVYWMGIAGDFCLKNTMADTFANFGPDSIKKSILLLDAQASIYPQVFDDFVKEMTAKGMRTAITTDFI